MSLIGMLITVLSFKAVSSIVEGEEYEEDEEEE